MKKKIALILLIICALFTCTSVYAACQGAQNETECLSRSEDGYLCEWNSFRKGGSRCQKGSKLTDEKIDEANKTYTSCNQITDHSTCTSSTINGYGCIWRQGACYDNRVPEQNEDTSNKVAGDKEQREEKYPKAQQAAPAKRDNNSEASKESTYDENIGDNFCQEKEAIKALHTVGYLLFVAKLFVPLIIIGAAIYDMSKAVVDPDKGMTASAKSILIRVVIGILIFFTPRIVYSILDIAQDFALITEDSRPCRAALLDPWNFGVDIGDTDGEGVETNPDVDKRYDLKEDLLDPSK